MKIILIISFVLFSHYSFCQINLKIVFDKLVGEEITLSINNNNFHKEIKTKEQNIQIKIDRKDIYFISALSFTHKSDSIEYNVMNDTTVFLKLYEIDKSLKTVYINADSETNNGRISLKGIEGVTIYAGKKNEIVDLKSLTVNSATNNARQVFSKVTGLNIWENDGGGLQLAIGGRGLNPNRISNFNTRQNGYDISADALGYPESYYTPPIEALDRIEVLRGAASLQYGPQFGGLINFKFKQPSNKKIEVTNRTTYGSFNFINSFNSLSGRINRFSYYTYFQFKNGKGWRDCSGFNYKNAFANFNYQLTEKIKLSFDYTYMEYIAQQPGGLTDAQFEKNPLLVLRRRNWFKVNWNLAAFKIEYLISDRLKLHSQTFVLDASRSALGVLTQINRADAGQNRDLWTDKFNNVGNETRLLYTYFIKDKPQNFLTGFRFYHGLTHRQQGIANNDSTGSKNDFQFIDIKNTSYSNYQFPSFNYSFFIENVFSIKNKLKIVPGIRFENIQTNAIGYYENIQKDFAGNVIFAETINESKSNYRNVWIAGTGISYKLKGNNELFSNFTQNYRSINFNDIRVVNPNLIVDPNLKDERGYSADIGIRGVVFQFLSYDVNIFYMNYENRIGTILKIDSTTFNIYRYRTNISKSYSAGLESFLEFNISKLFFKHLENVQLYIYNNTTIMDARYVNSKNPVIQNNKVEYAPPVIIKNGINMKWNNFSSSLQHSYTAEHYSDASNAIITSNAINGIIPSFQVYDLSLKYNWKMFALEGSINNLLNAKYFTRRAEGYPGPGILPSDPRTYFITLQIKI